MGKQLLEQLLPALEKMAWPTNPLANELGRVAYEDGIEKVDEFRGDPGKLAAALRTFKNGDSLPYAYAGIAYALIAAAREKDGSFVPAGLELAMSWLEKAQEHAPDLVSINFIEALIYTHAGRLEDARLILDYLHEQEPDNYYVITVEIAYWLQRNEMETTHEWYERGLAAANTIPQRLRLQSKEADMYLEAGNLEKALHTYKRALYFDRNNIRVLHALSVINFRLGDLEEAEHMNDRTLAIREFAAALQLRERIKEEKKAKRGGLGRLFK